MPLCSLTSCVVMRLLIIIVNFLLASENIFVGQRWVLKQNSLVSMTPSPLFFHSLFFLWAEKNENGWVMDTSEFCLRTHLRGRPVRCVLWTGQAIICVALISILTQLYYNALGLIFSFRNTFLIKSVITFWNAICSRWVILHVFSNPSKWEENMEMGIILTFLP